jgi:DNA invertase Pin-like site-specific DNA recombinase
MHISDARWQHDLRLCSRLDVGPRPRQQLAQLKAAGCEKVFREKITGTTAERPQLKKLMKTLAAGDVVIIPAVDRLSHDTTDLLVIARDLQRA